MKHSPRQSSAWFAWLMGGLIVWGLLLASGTLFFGSGGGDWRKPLIVLACSAGFLGFWGTLLWVRHRGHSPSPPDRDSTPTNRGTRGGGG